VETHLAGRNLYVFLDGDEVNDADAVNRALRPYWKGFGGWPRAVITFSTKDRSQQGQRQRSVVQPAIPNVFELTLCCPFVRSDGKRCISCRLAFPGPTRSRYPMVLSDDSRVRARLKRIDGEVPHWNGEYFLWIHVDREGRPSSRFALSKRHHLWLFPRGCERSAGNSSAGLGDARTPGQMGRN